MEIPGQISAEIDKLTPKSFAKLVNSALIFRLDQQLARLAADALRRVKYQLIRLKSKDQAFSLLSGLATVAAVTRTIELSEDVRVLLRVIRRRQDNKITPDNTMKIAMVAAAAYGEDSAWRTCVGEWLTELAFEDITRDEAINLLRIHKSFANWSRPYGRPVPEQRQLVGPF